MARVFQVTLFEREVRERLSEAAIELLLGSAQVLSEGECARLAGAIAPGPNGATVGERTAFFGSTMLTVDLAAVSPAVRENCDTASAHKVATLMATDPRVTRRVRQVAEREATRLAGGAVKPSSSDLRVRAQGTTVYIDVDLEGDLATTTTTAAGRAR
jgi:hypothetical protein